MKKVFFLFNLVILWSCNPIYEQYKNLNAGTQGNELYIKQLHLVKPLLSNEKVPFILVISWDKNTLVKNGNFRYNALVYNPLNGERKMFLASEENPKMIMQSNNVSDKNFRELNYILDNYIEGNEEYLLSLHDSFSSSEMIAPYYIFDFIKGKKLKIKSIFFDKNGNIIQ